MVLCCLDEHNDNLPLYASQIKHSSLAFPESPRAQSPRAYIIKLSDELDCIGRIPPH